MSDEKKELLIPTEKNERIEKALTFFNSLREVKFTNQDEYNKGVELCIQVKSEMKTLESDRTDLVKPFNDKVKDINATYKNVTSKLENAERVLKNGMNIYFQEQERKRIEQQKKLEAEAEAKRLEAEEKARKEQEKADTYREQGREDMAQKAEARMETAQAVAESIVAPVVLNTAQTSGVSYKTVWKATVEDQVKAVIACINNPALSSCVSLDIKTLERLCNAMKGKLTVEGVRFIEDKQVSVRS